MIFARLLPIFSIGSILALPFQVMGKGVGIEPEGNTLLTPESRTVLWAAGVAGLFALIGILTQRRQLRRLRQLEAEGRILHYFATSLLEQDTEDGILWDLAENCISQLGFVDCVIYLVDPVSQELVQKAATGPKSLSGRVILNPIVIPVGKGIVGSVARTGRAEVIEDTRLDARYIVDDERRLSEIAVPIIAEGKVLGVIDSEHPRQGFFTAEHLKTLSSIASLCANKLSRVRAVEELRKLNARLEVHVAERTAALRQSEERFSKAFQASPAILSIQSLPDGEFIDVNEAFLTTFGFTRHEVIGRTAQQLSLWRSAEKREEFLRACRSGEPIRNREIEYRTRTGQDCVLLQSAELIRLGSGDCILLVGQDISQSRRVETALAESEAHTRLIIDAALDAVVTMDAMGIIRGWNPQAQRFFGWTREEAVGRSLADTIIPAHMRQAHHRGLLHFLKTGEGPALNRRIEVSAIRRSGEEFPAELTVTALRVGGGYIFSAFIRDITERRRAEAELLKALDREKELNQLKSSFVSMVSHEFRTPLEVILTSSNILDRYLDRLPAEKREAQLRAIRRSVRRMSDLMDEVLLLGRIEAGRMECHAVPLDLPGFCRDLVAELEPTSRSVSRVHLQLGPLPSEALGDETLLQHILSNLLGNALKYSPADTKVEFSVTQQNSQAVFVIRDHGCGIPVADQERLFVAFHRGRNVGQTPGTGLGLVIVKRCVESHLGTLEFQSREGEGSTFTVRLPLFADASFFRKTDHSSHPSNPLLSANNSPTPAS